MPIKRYLERGVVFSPKTLSDMGQALVATAEVLGVGGDEKKRETVARFIIRLAQEDGSLDATALRDKALAALGGVSYTDMTAAPARAVRA